MVRQQQRQRILRQVAGTGSPRGARPRRSCVCVGGGTFSASISSRSALKSRCRATSLWSCATSSLSCGIEPCRRRVGPLGGGRCGGARHTVADDTAATSSVSSMMPRCTVLDEWWMLRTPVSEARLHAATECRTWRRRRSRPPSRSPQCQPGSRRSCGGGECMGAGGLGVGNGAGGVHGADPGGGADFRHGACRFGARGGPGGEERGPKRDSSQHPLDQISGHQY